MHSRLPWTVLTVVTVMSGCGGDAPQSARSEEPGRRPAARAEASGSRTAAEVARQERGAVHCPASAGPERPRGRPVDDVLGVRPGMSYEQAWNTVLCTHDLLIAKEQPGRGFNINTFGQKLRQGFEARFAEPYVAKTGAQIARDMQADTFAGALNRVHEDVHAGQAKWYVTTMGMPGSEQVIAVSREEHYPDTANPTVTALQSALVEKYGPPSNTQSSDSDIVMMNWAYDMQGHAVPSTSPIYSRCGGNADPDSPVNMNPDCGLAVHVVLQPTASNHALVKTMQVAVVSPDAGYGLVNATEEGLKQADAKRRAAEVQQASSAPKPAL